MWPAKPCWIQVVGGINREHSPRVIVVSDRAAAFISNDCAFHRVRERHGEGLVRFNCRVLADLYRERLASFIRGKRNSAIRRFVIDTRVAAGPARRWTGGP